MNKDGLIREVSESTGHPMTVVKDVLEGIVGTVQATVCRGEDVGLQGFGKWGRFVQRGRTARNPYTGESVEVSDKQVVRWKPSVPFKKRVNGE